MTLSRDSFPSEFLAHHSPLCFVAGLDLPPQDDTNARSDAFVSLKVALRKALTTKTKFPIWDNSRGANAELHTVFVDKNARFPPLKARPTSATATAAAGANAALAPASAALHSPISPLTPTSPLYPDGLIAPIWIRKHRELVPAVFVLVLRLYEAPGGYAGTGRSHEDEVEREDEERAHDAELVASIVDRKRTTLERGIKLAVVLLCSRELLDEPQLDARLSLIRRQSGLDSRASLFVISPVPQSEVNHFAHSLRTELYPAALDYYREHGRRVRRKRARIVVAGKGALSELGWNVRFDYKLALFAEMRGELEVALKHFEDCYDNLVEMFAQPGLLPPRTKRWAEAKVLADCISCKISKFYFYLAEPARAVAQLNRHVARFHTLSSGWQIGQDTYEFWSWLSKQYRLFGDLVSIALRNGAHLPSLRPPPAPRLPPSGSAAAPSPGLVPPNILQHAGHYYYLAAMCAVERRDRYRDMARAHKDADEKGAFSGQVNPAFAHEAKVEHGEIIVELFTKAYEFFKAHRAKNMTYMIAHEIALAHLEAGKPDIALKFLDRIVRSYRKDRFPVILTAILECMYRAAKEAKDYATLLRAGVELMSPKSTLLPERRQELNDELIQLLQMNPPAAEQAKVALDSSDTLPLLDCSVAFLRTSVNIGEPVDVQISLAAGSTSLKGVAFDRLEIQLAGSSSPVHVEHEDDAADVGYLRVGNLNKQEDRRARLAWTDAQEKVFAGHLTLSQEYDVSVEKLILTGQLSGWPVAFTLRPRVPSTEPVHWHCGNGERLDLPGNHGELCRVTRRDLRLQVHTSSATPAYLDERFPIAVEIGNDEDCEIEAELVAFLHPSDDGSQDTIQIDERRSTSLIDKFALGTITAGQRLTKTLFMTTLGRVSGSRTIEVTIRASPRPGSDSDVSLLPAPTEVTRTITVAVLPAISARFDSQVYKRRRPAAISNAQEWVAASDSTLIATLQASGPWDVEISDISLSSDNCTSCRVISSSVGRLETADAAQHSTILKPGYPFNALFALEVKPRSEDATAPDELFLDISWRRATQTGETFRSRIPVHPPTALPVGPSATLVLPPYLTMHEPVDLAYTFANSTSQSVVMTAQLDSPEVASTFVFSGPRRFGEFVIPPYEGRQLSVRVVPLVAGEWMLPRLRVWTVQHSQEASRHEPNASTAKYPAPSFVELEVDIEGDSPIDVDPAQAELEADLRTARDGDDSGASYQGPPGRAPIVLVLPR